MSVRTDIHNHSEHSFDGKFPVERMCRAAGEQGIDVFAITDHFEANEWGKRDYVTAISQSYSDIAEQKSRQSLILLAGIELGQQLEGPEGAAWLLSHFSWDLVIGSLHNTSGDEDFYYMDFSQMTAGEVEAAFYKYYLELLEMAEKGDFDTLAHITYPYRYLNKAREKRDIPLSPERFDQEADRIFEALISRGKALELNTGSIMRSKEDWELNRKYLKRYRALGGEYVTVGSDAHSPEHVGRGLREAESLLREAGFSRTVYYVNRQPVLAEI